MNLWRFSTYFDADASSTTTVTINLRFEALIDIPILVLWTSQHSFSERDAQLTLWKISIPHFWKCDTWGCLVGDNVLSMLQLPEILQILIGYTGKHGDREDEFRKNTSGNRARQFVALLCYTLEGIIPTNYNDYSLAVQTHQMASFRKYCRLQLGCTLRKFNSWG